MAFWQRAYEGEIMVDHRASPGLPEHVARLVGYNPQECKEGKLFESATRSCAHCGQRVILRPDRTRERAFCLSCASHYICDLCDAARREPDYVHRSFRDFIEETLKWQSASSQLQFPTLPQAPLVLRLPPASTWP